MYLSTTFIYYIILHNRIIDSKIIRYTKVKDNEAMKNKKSDKLWYEKVDIWVGIIASICTISAFIVGLNNNSSKNTIEENNIVDGNINNIEGNNNIVINGNVAVDVNIDSEKSNTTFMQSTEIEEIEKQDVTKESNDEQSYPDDYIITWEDETFGRKIQECLNKKDITYADVKNIKSLCIDSMNNKIGIDDYSYDSHINSPENRSGSISLNDLKYFTSLINLKVSNYEFVDCKIFENKNYLKNLLSINYISNISTEQINQMAKLQKLISLGIFKNNLNEQEIEIISSIENIESLTFDMCNITDITPLSNMLNLEYLNLSNNNISNINALKDLPNLQTVVLYNNNITDYSPVSHVKEVVKTLEEYEEFVND